MCVGEKRKLKIPSDMGYGTFFFKFYKEKF